MLSSTCSPLDDLCTHWVHDQKHEESEGTVGTDQEGSYYQEHLVLD